MTAELSHIRPGSALFMVTKMAKTSVMTDQDERMTAFQVSL